MSERDKNLAKMAADLADLKQMHILFAATLKKADWGMRQQQSAGLDQLLAELRDMQSLAASISHQVQEELAHDRHPANPGPRLD